MERVQGLTRVGWLPWVARVVKMARVATGKGGQSV